MTPTAFGMLSPLLAAQTPQTPATGAPAQPAAPSMQAAPAGQPQQAFKLPGAGQGQTQAPGTVTGATGGGQSPSSGGGFGMFLPLALVLLLVLVMTSMTGRKEKKRREALLTSVKRGDKVQTTAGIMGTIVELSDTEMTLRVDEGSNTRIRFSRAAVQQVLREGNGSGRPDMELKPRTPAATPT